MEEYDQFWLKNSQPTYKIGQFDQKVTVTIRKLMNGRFV